ncbi:MAG TPA: hypothetical protein VLI06_08460 [Solimonas sp.]|nr:hypothetical protein [Solimonas sp.]
MKRSASAAAALMGLLLALPAMAQDETTEAAAAETAEAAPAEAAPEAAAEAAPAEEAAPADATAEAAPAEAAPAEEAAPADVAAEAAPAEEAAVAEAPVEEAPPAEEVVAEEAPAEEAPAEETASEDSGEPFFLHVGVDMAEVDFSLSDELETKFGSADLDSSMYRLRVGMRLLEAVGLELQYGLSDDDGTDAGTIEIGEYYGVFLVPTGSLFELIEVSTPIGYSFIKGERGSASHEFDGVSYGLQLELPITLDSEWLPDIRIGGGGQVYQASHESRVYGYHFGVRLDFKI